MDRNYLQLDVKETSLERSLLLNSRSIVVSILDGIASFREKKEEEGKIRGEIVRP